MPMKQEQTFDLRGGRRTLDVRQKAGKLKQLRHLKREVNLLSQRIARLEAEIDDNARSRWRGRVVVEHGARLAALRDRLAQRRGQCMEQLGALYGFIDDIDDSLMRQIMAGRYIDGLTWKEVAARIGERDEQYPRRAHNRFLARASLPEAVAGIRADREGANAQNRGENYGKAN